MVKVYDRGGFRIYLYHPPREHEPPHVHVECTRGGEVVVRIGHKGIPASLWQNFHMRSLDAREALRIVQQHQETFLQMWRRLHGPQDPAS